MKIILLALVIVLLVFAGYVSQRPDSFSYERSGLINASPEKIFPYLNDFKLGNLWSPYAKVDPSMKMTFSVPTDGVGAKMEFAGNAKAGTGQLEIVRSDPPRSVDIRLEMIKPFHGTNEVQYRLTPEGPATRFTWTMTGQANFVSKLMSVLIDCDKMIGGQFSDGIANLKNIIEHPANDH